MLLLADPSKERSKKMVGYASGNSSPNPLWLDTLLSEKFFVPCPLHEAAKKNEKNIFCLDCCTSICPHCLSPHRCHRLLQVRRYVYHDVIRLDDLEKLIDCAYVQAYTTNSAKVVFLNQRPQSRPFRGSGNMCSTCDRSLQEPFLFCSLACKVHHLLRSEGSLSKYLYDCDYLPLQEGFRGEGDDLDDGQMTPDSVLDTPVSFQMPPAFVCESELVRKKRTSVSVSRPYRTCSPATEMVASIINNRRKGVPQRSPLY
ncbi:protein RGF1 INDUCIBLE TRANSCRIPTION FACTOR 1-like [Nymphaea colorata]|nr:protein RGF1 INDUCIBLE TRANSCRIPTION FACTOR 1-like [Nymphaea colorata]